MGIRTAKFVIGMIALTGGFSRLYSPSVFGEDANEPGPTTAPATAPAASRRPTTRPTTGPVLDRPTAILVHDLEGEDPDIRDKAFDHLRQMGYDGILPATVAAHAPSAEVRKMARAALKALPWDAPNDPAPIVQALHEFGRSSLNDQRQVIRWLAGPNHGYQQPAWRAIGQLLRYYPDPDVCWECVTQIRLHPMGQDLGIGNLPIDALTPPMKAVAGRVMKAKQPAIAARLLIGALTDVQEADGPVTNFDEVTAVLEDLLKVAADAHVEPRAADVIRAKLDVVPAMYRAWMTRELYALHGSAGPLPDLVGDLFLRPPDLLDPPTLYAIGQLERRMGQGGFGRVTDMLVFSATPLHPVKRGNYTVQGMLETRLSLAAWTFDHRFYEQSELELNEMIRAATPSDSYYRTGAFFLLARIDAGRNDDFLRGTHLRKAVEAMQDRPTAAIVLYDGKAVSPSEVQSVKAGMHLALMRAAIKTNDRPSATEHAGELAKIKPLDDTMLLEAWPLLNHSPPDAAAQAYFDANYNWQKLTSDRKGTTSASLAKLAWLCARCEEHLDEALILAQEAVDRDANSANAVAILAEVEFHMGHWSEAVKDQERAERIQPRDPIIQKNLTRYKIAAAKHAGEAVPPEMP